MEASILVSFLNDAGIDAWPEGGISAGFRAEAPGNANVLVRERDLQRAISLLRESVRAGQEGEPRHAPPTRPGPVETWRSRTFWMIVAWFVLALILFWVIGF